MENLDNSLEKMTEKLTTGQKIAKKQKNDAIVAKVTAKKSENLDLSQFNFAVVSKSTSYTDWNYQKIAENLKNKKVQEIFTALNILNEIQISEILKNPAGFINSKTKYDVFSSHKKGIRNFGQTEPKKINLLKNSEEKKQREINYKLVISVCK